jgi:hypothetical protein
VPASENQQPAIVTARKPRKSGKPPGATVPDMTADEHQRRGDAADALWRDLARGATGKG